MRCSAAFPSRSATLCAGSRGVQAGEKVWQALPGAGGDVFANNTAFLPRKQSWGDLISSQMLGSSEQFAFVYAWVMEGLSLVSVAVDKI